MFSTLFTVIRITTLLVLLDDYLKRNHLQKYEAFLVSTSYNAINLYSKGQLILNKVFANLKTFIDSSPRLKKIIDDIYSKEKLPEIKHIKNGEQISLYNKDDQDFFDNFTECESDFLLFSDYSNVRENICVNKKIIINKPFTFDYELTNFSFLLIEFVIGEKIYKINLKDRTYNFYVVDNIFDINFFIYYLTTHYPEKISKNDIDITQSEICVVKIVDHNVKTRSLDMKKNGSIKLSKDGYVLYTKQTKIMDDINTNNTINNIIDNTENNN
jgi:hypothetical protein